MSLYSHISPLTAPTGHSPGTKCSPAQSCAEPRGSVTLRECQQCPGAALHTDHRCSWQEFGLPCPQPRVENRREAELCVCDPAGPEPRLCSTRDSSQHWGLSWPWELSPGAGAGPTESPRPWGGMFSTRLHRSCSITWSLASQLELLPTCMGRAFGKKKTNLSMQLRESVYFTGIVTKGNSFSL